MGNDHTKPQPGWFSDALAKSDPFHAMKRDLEDARRTSDAWAERALAAESAYTTLLANHNAAIAGALEEIGRLRALLKPFADWRGTKWDEEAADEVPALTVPHASGWSEITMGDLRRARSTLAVPFTLEPQPTDKPDAKWPPDLAAACLRVACRICGAAAGEECVGPVGRWHFARWEDSDKPTDTADGEENGDG